MFLNPDDLVVTSIVLVVDKSIPRFVVIALSSDKSTANDFDKSVPGSVVIPLSSNESAANDIGAVDVQLATPSQKGKAKLPIYDKIDDCSDDEFVLSEVPIAKKHKISYESTRKFQDTWVAHLS